MLGAHKQAINTSLGGNLRGSTEKISSQPPLWNPVSLVVGFCALFLALLIGIPLGLCAGYFAGKTDLIICRLIEIWEAMPTFLMLLLIVAITQSKSIFLIISVLGIFGWTGLSRFIVLKP